MTDDDLSGDLSEKARPDCGWSQLAQREEARRPCPAAVVQVGRRGFDVGTPWLAWSDPVDGPAASSSSHLSHVVGCLGVEEGGRGVWVFGPGRLEMRRDGRGFLGQCMKGSQFCLIGTHRPAWDDSGPLRAGLEEKRRRKKSDLQTPSVFCHAT